MKGGQPRVTAWTGPMTTEVEHIAAVIGRAAAAHPIELAAGPGMRRDRPRAPRPHDERARPIEAEETQKASITARSPAPSRFKRCQNVPDNVAEMPLVVSVTVTPVKTTVIGGVQSGWNVAVSVSSKVALPFWTGKSPSAETLALLAALG
ncbi:MAG: hypothetical protein K0S97_106 [Chloroflexota bacterium]|nr:hypothetical protein [Chloroflexota bacterium]